MASISDFTWRLYRTCTKRAPELSTEVNDIYTALHILDDEMSSQLSFFSDLVGPQKAEYTSILGECVADLQELESLIRHRPNIARHGEASGKESVASLLESLRPRLRKHAKAFNALMEKLELVNAEEEYATNTHRRVPGHSLPSRTNGSLNPETDRIQGDKSITRSHQPYVETIVDSEEDDTVESEAERVLDSVPVTFARPDTPFESILSTPNHIADSIPGVPKSGQRQRQQRRRGSSTSAGISRAGSSRLCGTNDGSRETRRAHTSRPTKDNNVNVANGPDGEWGSDDGYETEPLPAVIDRPTRTRHDPTRTNRQTQSNFTKRAHSPSSWSSTAVSGRQAQVSSEERAVRRTKKKDLSVQELKDEIARIERKGRRVHFQDQINHVNGPAPAYPGISSPPPVLGPTPYFTTTPYSQPQYSQQPIHPAFANFQQYPSPSHFPGFTPQQSFFSPAAAPWHQTSPAPPPYAHSFGPFGPPPPVAAFHTPQQSAPQAPNTQAESKPTTKKFKDSGLVGPLLVDGNGVCHYSNCGCRACT